MFAVSFFLNKCCSLELSLHQGILKKMHQFIKSTLELKTGVISAEFSFAITAIINIIKYIQIEKGYFKLQ